MCGDETSRQSNKIALLKLGLPSVGEAVPQALAVTPEQSVEDTVKQPVEVEALYVWLPPDSLQCRAYVGTHNVQHLSDR